MAAALGDEDYTSAADEERDMTRGDGTGYQTTINRGT